MGLGKMAQGHRQGADMIVVAMRQSDGLHLFFGNELVERETVASLALRMRSSVEEQTESLNFDEPGAGSDVSGWIEVDDAPELPINEG